MGCGHFQVFRAGFSLRHTRHVVRHDHFTRKNGATLTAVQLVDTLNEIYTSVSASIAALDMNESAAEQPAVHAIIIRFARQLGKRNLQTAQSAGLIP